MGLSPILTEQIFNIITEINSQGTTVLLVEQNAQMALNAADRGYVIQTGKIILADTAANLAANEQVRRRIRRDLSARRLCRPIRCRRSGAPIRGRPIRGHDPGPPIRGHRSGAAAQRPARLPSRPTPDARLGILLVAVVIAWVVLSPLILPRSAAAFQMAAVGPIGWWGLARRARGLRVPPIDRRIRAIPHVVARYRDLSARQSHDGRPQARSGRRSDTLIGREPYAPPSADSPIDRCRQRGRSTGKPPITPRPMGPMARRLARLAAQRAVNQASRAGADIANARAELGWRRTEVARRPGCRPTPRGASRKASPAFSSTPYARLGPLGLDVVVQAPTREPSLRDSGQLHLARHLVRLAGRRGERSLRSPPDQTVRRSMSGSSARQRSSTSRSNG